MQLYSLFSLSYNRSLASSLAGSPQSVK